jgi:predicted  nucleic acid-binding Zn-ribbon protein
MTEEDKKVISVFEGKLRHFMFLYEKLEQENAGLKQQLLKKEEDINQLKQNLQESEARYADLKTARTISLYDKDIKETKQRLSGLVREIDKCIALLNG